MRKFLSSVFTSRNLLWFFSMLAFTILCVEIFGNIYLTKVLQKSTERKFRFNSYRLYEHVPGFREGDGKRNWILINNQGFRRTVETTHFKPKGTYRIFLLGGSAAHGVSTSPPYPLVHTYPDQTIDAYLEKMLGQQHPGVHFEVINAAVTGYKVHQHTAYILSELLDYDPDMLIFFDGANDHYVNNPAYNIYLDDEYQFWKKRLQDPSLGGNFVYFLLWMSKWSAFSKGYMAWKLQSDSIHEATVTPRVKYYKTEDEWIRNHRIAAKKTFLRSIETNINILKSNNLDCVLTLQPMLVLRNKNLMSQEEKKWLHRDDNCKLLYPVVIEEVSSLAKKYGVDFIDMNLAFNQEEYGGKQLLVDYCHLSPLGAEVIAATLLPAVNRIYANSVKNQK